MDEYKKNWKNKYALKTHFDGYDKKLRAIIDLRAKYPTRAKGKPMAEELRSRRFTYC